MKNEDAIIVGLTIIVLIVAAIALLVTGSGISFNNGEPTEGTAPKIQTNMTNATNNSTQHHDTGITAPEGETRGSSYSFDSSYDSSSTSGSSSTTQSSSSSSSQSSSQSTTSADASPSSESGSSSSSSESSESGTSSSDSGSANVG